MPSELLSHLVKRIEKIQLGNSQFICLFFTNATHLTKKKKNIVQHNYTVSICNTLL